MVRLARRSLGSRRHRDATRCSDDEAGVTAEAEVYPLPGRDWHTYLGPQNVPTERISFGVSIFPAGSHPEGHVHDTQEETIYCVVRPRSHHHPRRGR